MPQGAERLRHQEHTPDESSEATNTQESGVQGLGPKFLIYKVPCFVNKSQPQTQ